MPDTSPSHSAAAQSCNATYTRPKTRQRVHKAPAPLDVPHIEQDAAERKRVLNVLAQRRYRERKRQLRQAQEPGQGQKTSTPEEEDELTRTGAAVDAGTTSSSGGTADMAQTSPGGGVPLHGAGMGDLLDIDMDMGADWAPMPTGFDGYAAMAMMTSMASPSGQLPNFLPPTMGPETFPAGEVNFIDPSYLAGSGGDTSDASHTQSSSSSRASSSNSPGSLALSTGSGEFPDSYYLEVNELTILRAFLRIATRLGFTGNMWSMAAVSPFNEGKATPAELLPETWRPTASQMLVPHHPVVDFLPWPSVRDRVLSVFSLPPEMRPEEAQGPLALVNLAYDLEDSAEGIRIWGSDPYDPANWEVGQVLFERWWFLFDRSVVGQSNKLRVSRGADVLRMASPTNVPGRRVQNLDEVVQGYVQ